MVGSSIDLRNHFIPEVVPFVSELFKLDLHCGQEILKIVLDLSLLCEFPASGFYRTFELTVPGGQIGEFRSLSSQLGMSITEGIYLEEKTYLIDLIF